MTYPRSHLVDATSSGIYHVQSRCVRRAWLCGVDPDSGRDFTHRRDWIENRMLELARYFAISIYGYAVMSNHYHIVLEVRPSECSKWSDEDVAEKWLALCPGRNAADEDNRIRAARKSALLTNPERLQVIRARLGSLSWFMRFINEPLARFANQEDGCTGRFWQGRFQSQRLLDEAAVLAAMVYVDLNPVRAGVAEGVTDSAYTSLHRRMSLQQPTERLISLEQRGAPLSIHRISLGDYIDLVNWTAAAQASWRRGGVAANLSLERREIAVDEWFYRYLPRPGRWQRAIGSVNALKDYAARLGQTWIQMRSVSSSAS